MTTLVDTLRLVASLKQSGFTPQQAEGIVQALTAQEPSHLATKADLRDELRALEVRLLKWAAPVLVGQIAVFAAIVEWMTSR